MSQDHSKAADGRVADDADSYFSRIRTNYDALTESQRRIADYLCRHRDEVLTNSITALSRKIGTNPPALTRFCQAIHYKGFGEFKFFLGKALVAPLGSQREVERDDDINTVRNKLLDLSREAIADTLLLLDQHQVARAAKAICDAGMVHLYADGGPGASSNFAYQLFLQIGVPCNFFIDSNLSLMAAGQLRRGDVAIGITYSGFSKTTIEALEVCRQRDATIIGITARVNSPVARMADIPLCYSLKIADDLRYLHIARMCEVAILGLLQSVILNRIPDRVAEHIQFSKNAIGLARRTREKGKRGKG